MLMIVLFWLCLVAVAYHHIGFPPLLLLLAREGRRRHPAAAPAAVGTPPSVSVIIPAYQEARHIQAKLENLAGLDYPRERLEVVVASDGSTDETNLIAAKTIAGPACAGLRVELKAFP